MNIKDYMSINHNKIIKRETLRKYTCPGHCW